MKKSFSLLELITVIALISILLAFFIPKGLDSLNKTMTSKIKSEIALIRNGISKKITSNRLLNKDLDFILDDADIEADKSRLFTNILDYPLLSTTSSKKELGQWIKSSSNSYKVYLSSNEFLDFRYKDLVFECRSSKELCVRFE